jgi:hypothetical protein
MARRKDVPIFRLALSVITGNGDMHLKNWSLIYRGHGFKPELAPVDDVLSTVPYIPADIMVPSHGGAAPSRYSTRSNGRSSPIAQGDQSLRFSRQLSTSSSGSTP